MEKEEVPVEIALPSMTPMDKKKMIDKITKAMRRASRDLDFESAARLRDTITSLTRSQYF